MRGDSKAKVIGVIGIDRFLQNIYYEISSKQRFVFVMDDPTTLEIIVGICMIIGFVSWLEAMLQAARKEVL